MTEVARTAEQVALARHEAFIRQDRVWFRFLDHHYPHVASGLHGHGEVNSSDELSAIKPYPLKPNTFFAKRRGQTAAEYLDDQEKNIRFYPEWSKLGDKHINMLRKRVKQLSEKKIELGAFREDVRKHLGEMLAQAPDDLSAANTRARLNDGVRRARAGEPMTKAQRDALALSFIAPNHVDALRRLLTDPAFGRKMSERERVVRAASYLIQLHDDKKEFATGAPAEPRDLEMTLDWGDRVGGGPSNLGRGLLPRSYNAVAFIYPNALEYRPFGLGWERTNTEVKNPIQALQILEPSVRAAREAWQRYYDAHWKDHPEDAFPIYDYRGRLVWPKAAK